MTSAVATLLENSQIERAASAELPAVLQRPHRDCFGWALFAAVGLLAALAGPMLARRVYTADDLGAFHLPLRAFYQDCLVRGERFDWSPQLYCGFYLTGEGQVGAYHPWHWLLYKFLPLSLAFDLECVVNYPLLLVGMYCLLRRWRLRRDAALFGATAFTFSGFCLLHFVHVNAIAVVAHLPWLLLAIDVALRSPRPARRTWAGAAISLLTASQVLLGYPQYVGFSLLVEIGYAAWLLRNRPSLPLRKDRAESAWRRKSTGRLCAAASLLFWISVGIAIGGVQLLPTWDALRESSRQAADASFSGTGSLAPLNVVQLIAPYLFRTRVVGQNTHELGLYAGSVTLLLAVWCVFGHNTPSRFKPLVRAALFLGGFGFLFAMGPNGPLQPLAAWLPIVNKFRFPCRATVLVEFSLAVLAAIGFLAIGTRPQRSFGPTGRAARRAGAGLTAVWALATGSVVLAIIGPICWHDYVATPALIAAGALLSVASATLITLALKDVRWAKGALAVLSAVDLGIYGLSYAVYPQATTLTQFIAAHPGPSEPPSDRVAVDLVQPNGPGIHQGNEVLLSGWRRVDGYAGLEPARRLDYRQPNALRAAGVGWIAAGLLALPAENKNGTWSRLAAPPLPRARLVTQTFSTTDAARDISHIAVDAAALLDEAVQLDGGSPGSVVSVDDRPGSIHLAVQAPSRQLLVVAERWHAGWMGTVDGRPAPVLRVNGDFLGCLVGPGAVDVRLEFRPASLRSGLWLTACGLGLLVVGLLAAHLRPEPHSPECGCE